MESEQNRTRINNLSNLRMRSIANFPTGMNRNRLRRKPNSEKSWNRSPPVWGRSAAVTVALSSSPVSESSLGSGHSDDGSSSSSMSQSPVAIAPSPIWGRSARATIAATHRKKMNTTGSIRSRTPSPPPSVEYRDEDTTTTTYQQKQLLAPLVTPLSSPRPHYRQMPSHDLCTIAEDRRISSNTLSKMAVTTSAKEIAASPVLAKPQLQMPQRQRQNPLKPVPLPPPPVTKRKYSRFRDPYNDDSNEDYEDEDCAGCWAWPFGKHPPSHSRNIHIPSSSRKAYSSGFPSNPRRVHARRISF